MGANGTELYLETISDEELVGIWEKANSGVGASPVKTMQLVDNIERHRNEIAVMEQALANSSEWKRRKA